MATRLNLVVFFRSTMAAPMNLMNIWRDFAQETSLNGWSFLAKPGLSWIQRLFWILAIVISVSGAVYFNMTFLNEFFAATVLVTVKSVSASLNNVIFPSIVVCNHNQVTNVMTFVYFYTFYKGQRIIGY